SDSAVLVGPAHAVQGLCADTHPDTDHSGFPPFVRVLFPGNRHAIVQLTAFSRNDTAAGGEGGRGVVIGDRVLFSASANPFGENPGQVCQLFSISTRGDALRQLTHLPWDGQPNGGVAYTAPRAAESGRSARRPIRS